MGTEGISGVLGTGQLLHYVTTSLPLSHEDEDHEEEGHDIPGELTDLHNVGG